MKTEEHKRMHHKKKKRTNNNKVKKALRIQSPHKKVKKSQEKGDTFKVNIYTNLLPTKAMYDHFFEEEALKIYGMHHQQACYSTS